MKQVRTIFKACSRVERTALVVLPLSVVALLISIASGGNALISWVGIVGGLGTLAYIWHKHSNV